MIRVYCNDCAVLLNPAAQRKKQMRCHSCEIKRRYKLGIMSAKGKHNSNYKHGRKIKRYFNCKDCGKKLSKNPSIRCKSCANKAKRNPRYGTHNKGNINRNTIVNHHIYGKEFKDTMNLTVSQHSKLHHRAYEYLIKIKKVKDYIKWFTKIYMKE